MRSGVPRQSRQCQLVWASVRSLRDDVARPYGAGRCATYKISSRQSNNENGIPQVCRVIKIVPLPGHLPLQDICCSQNVF